MQELDSISGLQRSLSAGRFTVTAEVSPPVSAHPAAFIAGALPLKGLATALNVTDGAGARVHMSSLAAAHFLLQNGMELVLQLAMRDRNRIALQSDLLGAAALGIRNILVVRCAEASIQSNNPKWSFSFISAPTTQSRRRRSGSRSRS